MQLVSGAGQFTAPDGGAGNHWTEQLRSADLSVGTYSISRGGVDDQEPHTEDEIYVITAGSATLVAGPDGSQDRLAVSPGSVVYVAAGEEHRFVDVTADLAALVLFAPAEGARSGAAPS